MICDWALFLWNLWIRILRKVPNKAFLLQKLPYSVHTACTTVFENQCYHFGRNQNLWWLWNRDGQIINIQTKGSLSTRFGTFSIKESVQDCINIRLKWLDSDSNWYINVSTREIIIKHRNYWWVGQLIDYYGRKERSMFLSQCSTRVGDGAPILHKNLCKKL